jgi:hypothetical protein
MTVKDHQKLKLGDPVQIQGTTKNRYRYAHVKALSTTTDVTIELDDGEVQTYNYRNLRVVEDFERGIL